MKRLIKHMIKITIMVFVTSSISAADLPDPEVLAKQYLKDLCTLNEQDFARKYMLMQADADFFINEMTVAYKKMNSEMPGGKLSDSLAMRSKVQKLVVRSYRAFKEWQHTNKIDSSKIIYHSCEFELEKKRDLPFYTTGNTKIYFTVDTLNYVIICDDFAFIKNKWFAGDLDDVRPLDKSFREINDYTENYDYSADTVAAVSYNENDYPHDGEPPLSKKQLKIQKKIDAYNRKIDALHSKQDE
jgi:hypothetical protein